MDDDEKAINITNFINPYQFWYCLCDEHLYIQIRDNEEALSKFYKEHNNGASREFQADLEVGNKIAVRLLNRNKYIRARIDYIKQQRSSKTYIVWALDHGYPFETEAQYCRVLPADFDIETGRVQCGGIDKIVPAEKEYDFLEQQTVTVIKDKWSDRACESLEKIILDHASIEFIERFKTPEQNWGDLIIRNHKGKTFRVSDYLINEDVALRNSEKFKQQCLTPRRIVIPCWQTNNGNNKYTVNIVKTAHALSMPEIPPNPLPNLNDSDFNNAQFKVAAWSDFNRRAANYDGKAPSVIDNSDSVSTIYDTDYEVGSIVSDGFKSLTLNQVGGGAVGGIGSASIQSSNIKKLPPPPSVADFGYPAGTFLEDDNSSIATLESQKIRRTQHLMMMRAKSKQKHAQIDNGNDTVSEFNISNIKLPKSMREYDTIPEDKIKDQTSTMSISSSTRKFFDEFEQNGSIQTCSIRRDYLNKMRKKQVEINSKRQAITAAATAEDERNSNASSQRKHHASRPPTNMIPAGFDLGNLMEYNKKDHWHRKETTRHEYHPHDQSISSENDDQNQDFRFTRPNTDKFKTNATDEGILSNSNPMPIKSPQTESTTNEIESQNLTNFSENFKKNGEDILNDILNKKKKERYETKPLFNASTFEPSIHSNLNPTAKELTENPPIEIKPLFNASTQSSIYMNLNQKPKEPTRIEPIETKALFNTSNLNPKTIKTPQEISTPNKIETNSAEINEDNKEDDDTASNASTPVSMYSAKSLMDDGDDEEEEDEYKSAAAFHSPNHSYATQKLINDAEDLLENFIKRKEIPNENETKNDIPKKQAPESSSESIGTLLIGSHKLRLKYKEHSVLAHCQLPLNTIENLDKILLPTHIRDAMRSRCINSVYRTQTYVWPHTIQGNSTFIINGPESGKTWSYIPSICAAISNCIDNQLALDTYGPLAIIIVASAKQVLDVEHNCSYLLHKLERRDGDAKTIGSYGLRDFIKTKIQLMEKCGILVVTPPNLQRLLKDNERKDPLFNSKRLQHIIIDDIDTLLKRCKSQLQEVLKTIFTLVPKKNKKIEPQLIVTSRLYLPILEKLIPISNQPLLVMGDFLETAVYGKAKICIEFCLKAQKVERILEFIKTHPYAKESLMILCNSDDDVFTIGEGLESAGIDCLGYHSNSSTMIRDQILKLKNSENIHSKVLICNDAVLSELEIQNVQNVIHFSLADSWTKLKFRFSVHLKMYENLIVNGFKIPTAQRVNSLILLDEGNNLELPRLIEFFEYHNQTKLIPENILTLSKKIKMLLEIERRNIKTQICSLPFEYGDCDEPACLKRHVLIKEDIDTSQNENKMPLLQNGDLRMVILNVFSPTYYTARLIEHRLTSDSDWHIIKESKKFASFMVNFNMFYSRDKNRIQHWPININDICVYRKNDTYHRARVLKVPTLKSHNIIKTLDVMIKLIDSGNVIEEKSNKLYVCDERFKSFTPQAIDIRLIGILPFDNERNWDEETTRHVKGILMDHLKKNSFVHANICCSLVDTIFVRDVVVMEKLPTLEKYVFRIDLRKYLAQKKYGLIDAEAVERTFNIIKKYGLEEILKQKEEELEEHERNMIRQQEVAEKNKAEAKEQRKENSKGILKPKQTVRNEKNNTEDSEKQLEISKPKSKIHVLNDLRKQKNQEENQALVKFTANQDDDDDNDDEKSLCRRENTIEEPVCSVLEFFETFRRANLLDAEDCEFHNEEIPDETRNYFRVTDMMAQNAIMAEQRRMGITPILQPQAIMEAPRNIAPPPSVITNGLPTLREEEINETDDSNEDEEHEEQEEQAISTDIPRLDHCHKRPETIWYQTNHLIILSIKAPDINDYYLEVSRTDLYFQTMINDVEHVLILNFLGTIKPELVSHEIRGLNVIVRLFKSIFMKWPRLVKQTDKLPWLNTDYSMLNVEEIMPQQFYERILNSEDRKPTGEDDSDWSDDDGENFINNFKTHHQIRNNEDIHDPINSEMF